MARKIRALAGGDLPDAAVRARPPFAEHDPDRAHHQPIDQHARQHMNPTMPRYWLFSRSLETTMNSQKVSSRHQPDGDEQQSHEGDRVGPEAGFGVRVVSRSGVMAFAHEVSR